MVIAGLLASSCSTAFVHAWHFDSYGRPPCSKSYAWPIVDGVASTLALGGAMALFTTDPAPAPGEPTPPREFTGAAAGVVLTALLVPMVAFAISGVRGAIHVSDCRDYALP